MYTPGSRTCAYKAASGQLEWPSRDPMEENGGVNLYAGMLNDPLGFIDPLGTKCSGWEVKTASLGFSGSFPIGAVSVGWDWKFNYSFSMKKCDQCCGKPLEYINYNANLSASLNASTYRGSIGTYPIVLSWWFGVQLKAEAKGQLSWSGVYNPCTTQQDQRICLTASGKGSVAGGGMATLRLWATTYSIGADIAGSGTFQAQICYIVPNGSGEGYLGKPKMSVGLGLDIEAAFLLGHYNFTLASGNWNVL